MDAQSHTSKANHVKHCKELAAKIFWGIFSESVWLANKPESGRKQDTNSPKRGAACRKTPRNNSIYRFLKSPASFSMEKLPCIQHDRSQKHQETMPGFIPKRNRRVQNGSSWYEPGYLGCSHKEHPCHSEISNSPSVSRSCCSHHL